MTLATDTTAPLLKQTQDMLLHLQQQLRFISDCAPVPLAQLSREGRYRFVNAAYAARYGRAPDYFVGKSLAEVFGPDILSQVQPHIDRVLRGERFQSEMELQYADLGLRTMQVDWTPDCDAHGHPRGWVVAITDTTSTRGAREAEERLRESEERMRTFLESLPQLVWSCRADGHCDYLSPQWLRYTGQTAVNQFGTGWLDAVHPADRPQASEVWHRAVSQGTEYHVEYRLRRADGVYRWFAALGVPVRNSDGAITRWYGGNTDIDDRMRAEALVRENRERLTAALAASSTGTFRWSIRTHELEWDDELDRLFGLRPDQTARSLPQFIQRVHPDDRARVIAACDRCARDGADFHEEFRVVWPDGSLHWLEDKGRTFFGDDGRPEYMTGACVDVTKRRLAEEEARDARNRLQQYASELESKVEERTASLKQAVTQMEEFSYSVSHDLRAPIRSINQYAKLLAEDFGAVLGETGLHYVQRMIRSTDRMNQLTLDTLALSRITRAVVKVEPVSLDVIVSDILNENGSLQEPRAQVIVESPLGVVLGVNSLLTQAISNLLVNAAKFVAAGQVPQIRVWTQLVDGKPRLYVRDNGIGVPPELQQRLFGIFERVHHGYEGTGIGLAIVRKAIERLGGTAGMESDGRNGSTFWLQFQPSS